MTRYSSVFFPNPDLIPLLKLFNLKRSLALEFFKLIQFKLNAFGDWGDVIIFTVVFYRTIQLMGFPVFISMSCVNLQKIIKSLWMIRSSQIDPLRFLFGFHFKFRLMWTWPSTLMLFVSFKAARVSAWLHRQTVVFGQRNTTPFPAILRRHLSARRLKHEAHSFFRTFPRHVWISNDSSDGTFHVENARIYCWFQWNYMRRF